MPQKLPSIGWREYIALPELNIPEIKAKIDTGARSSALHAFNISEFERDGKTIVSFSVHPYQRDRDRVITAEAALFDRRSVRSSSGESQLRPVIQTVVELGGQRWAIELTLTNRDEMGFRMLLGREAVRQRFLVDAGNSYIQNPQQSSQADIDEE